MTRTSPDGGSAVGIWGPEHDAPDLPASGWSDKLYVNKPMPRDGWPTWIVTVEGQVVTVAWDDEATHCLGMDIWSRTDGESGCYADCDILGWTNTQEDAEEAARLLMEVGG